MLERPQSIPDAPGSYQFKDAAGRIIYVGKARSLRSRVSSYFQDPVHLHPRTAQMVERAASVEWIVVASDVEAIMLEYNLIKAHRPRFNIRLVDDKSYPYLAVTVGDEWPKATVMRGAKRKDTRYFGPYAHAYAIRDTLDLLLRSFPIRTCSDAKLRRHELLGRPCLMYHIERCSGPCVGAVEPEEYGRLVGELMAFLDGDTRPVVDRLEAEMHQAAAELEFERAARFRDRLATVRLAIERQQMVTDTPENLDAVAIAEDELAAAVQVLHVRRGRVVGRHGFIVEKVEPLTTAQLIGRVLEQHYAETPIGIPRELLVPELPEDVATYEAWLSGLRGGKVRVIVPKRGRKRELLATARQNAADQLARHRLRRASDLSSRAVALEELQSALGMTEAPLRIECYDMSHIQGTDYVGSMVVLEDGLPKRSDYRRFKVTAVQGNDDYGAMHEVLTRRLRRLFESPDDAGAQAASGTDPTDPAAAPDAADGRRRRGPRFAYPPQLLLLDGGKGQLGVGVRVLEELQLTGKVAVAALAKQLEEVFVPGRPDPVRIPRDSEAIYLLQQARDEAHRFAIGFHRELRGRRMTRGALDGAAGLGPARRRRLISELGGVKAVQAASLDDLLGLAWLPDTVAHAVYEHLHAAATFEGRLMSTAGDPWEHHATWWRETFTNGADLEYELQILPLAAQHLEGLERVLDLGSGEGHLARRLSQQAKDPRTVVGLEPSVAQLASAVRQGGGPSYVRGVGERLPFRDGSFDGVVCCLVIEHSTDPDALLAEAVRVLADGGRFVLFVNHPMFQGTGSGFVDDQIMGEHYWRVGPYLREDVVIEEVDPGVRLRFAHRPLSRYVNPVTALGCVLTRLEEPEPPAEFLEGSIDLELESAIPRLLLLRFERLARRQVAGCQRVEG